MAIRIAWGWAQRSIGIRTLGENIEFGTLGENIEFRVSEAIGGFRGLDSELARGLGILQSWGFLD